MTLYLGRFKHQSQIAANVALTNFDNLLSSPILGYSLYLFGKIGHFIG
jgi:hypothetical protein